MASPNLMVEISPHDLGDLITALTFHVGEVKRNPYHLSLPAWMLERWEPGEIVDDDPDDDDDNNSDSDDCWSTKSSAAVAGGTSSRRGRRRIGIIARS